VITPYFFEDFGKNSDLERLFRYTTTLNVIVAYFMSLFLPLVFICAPAFVSLVLPKFSPGIVPLRIFLVTIFFSSHIEYFSNYFVALNKQSWILGIILIGIVANICLNFMFIQFGFGINGVACATAIASMLTFILMFAFAMKGKFFLKQVSTFAKIVMPFLYASFIVFLLERYVNLGNVLIAVVLKCSLFIISFLPLVFLLNKEVEFLPVLKKLIDERLIRFKGKG
nr:polysaccharide biosynthesis C-terminal domain-containing protein [Candidatus Omnitrophota bacterium]